MRILTVLMAAAFFMAAGSVGEINSADAKAHVTPGKPGKCGVGKYYSKKDKGCLSKM